MLISHAGGKVDHKLKEIIRVQLARTAGDTYFSNLRSAKAIEQGLTEAQIMELGAFIALHYGMQVFMRTLAAFPLRGAETEPWPGTLRFPP